jgi:hypothetical protein
MGPLRVLDVGRGLWLVVADAPLDRYGEDAINRKLSDLDWVSRAAIAHEAVVESFTSQRALLPMKLFTIFTSDDRAVDHVRHDRPRIELLVKRVTNHQEWGVRVTRPRPESKPAGARRTPVSKSARTGLNYLSRKKSERDAAAELAQRARETVGNLYERLSARSTLARRRLGRDLPVQGGPLLLDAAFLVSRSRVSAFRALAGREARRLARDGYRIALTGPWPPYTFVKD